MCLEDKSVIYRHVKAYNEIWSFTTNYWSNI